MAVRSSVKLTVKTDGFLGSVFSITAAKQHRPKTSKPYMPPYGMGFHGISFRETW